MTSNSTFSFPESVDAFEFIKCETTKSCIQNGIWALNQLGSEAWEWLRNYSVDPALGFMFANDTMLDTIDNQMESDNAPVRVYHSGASFGFTMRTLHYIAQNGFDAYKTLYIQNKANQDEN